MEIIDGPTKPCAVAGRCGEADTEATGGWRAVDGGAVAAGVVRRRRDGGVREARRDRQRWRGRAMLSLFGLVRVKMQNVNRFASYDSTA
jgi:hypothetical protein